MGNQFNGPPGNQGSLEKCRQTILLWEAALYIATLEDPSTKDEVPVDPEYAIEQAREKFPEVEKFLPEAQNFMASDRVKIQRESLVTSPLGIFKNCLKKHYQEELEKDGIKENGDEEVFFASPEEIIDTFFACLLDRKMSEGHHYISITKELLDVIDSIYQEIEYYNFKSQRSKEEKQERLAHVRNLGVVNYFAEELNGWLEKWLGEDKACELKKKMEKTEDPISEAISFIDNSPDELVAILVSVISKIVADLETRDFPTLPDEPKEVQKARKKLLH